MAQNKSQIATLALRRLGFVSEEQPASGFQQTEAENGVTRAHGELAHLGIAWWAVDECPDDIAGPFAQYVAGELAAVFMEPQKAAIHEAQMGPAIRRMTAVTGKRDYSDLPVRFDDF